MAFEREQVRHASPPREAVAPAARRSLILAGAATVLMLAATLWLWAAIGGAIFFEVIRAGLAGCIG